MYISIHKLYLEKNFNNDGNKKFLVWIGFGSFTSFLAALHRFRPFDDGNLLPTFFQL